MPAEGKDPNYPEPKDPKETEGGLTKGDQDKANEKELKDWEATHPHGPK